MKTSVLQPSPSLIPAAEYLRMSDELQQYSLYNQRTAIREYAARHGFVIVKTYADAGKSGVTAKDRRALRELLKDVVSGEANYKAILIYDVSRWGRFQNSDEAAHYEFLCSSSGIPLHYCAEQFANDGTATSTLLKSLKRSMAAEFSRELGEKVHRGKAYLVRLGFWVGGPPGYGYRRLMVSADGTPKAILKEGEHKNFTSDREVLVLGPEEEVQAIRKIFAMAAAGIGPTAIARQLTADGISRNGKPWVQPTVVYTLGNPKYAGWNVWSRGTLRLSQKRVPVNPQHWITKKGAFPPIIDQATFDRAQSAQPRRWEQAWPNERIVKRLRRLLAAKGRLSANLILEASHTPTSSTLYKHFGTYRQAYSAAGFHLPQQDAYGNLRSEHSMSLRRRLVQRLKHMFPNHVSVTNLPNGLRSVLLIDNTFFVSIMLCRYMPEQPGGACWVLTINPAERKLTTLVCRLNRRSQRILSYHLLPCIEAPGKTYRLYADNPWLKAGKRLTDLSQFYSVAKWAWRQPKRSAEIVSGTADGNW